MKKALGIGLLSIALSQNIYAVNATRWWELDEINQNRPEIQNPTLTDPLTIFEDSTLTLGNEILNPQLNVTRYDGSIIFDHNLGININYNGNTIVNQNMGTTIYTPNGRKTFGGIGSLNINLDSSQSSGDGIKALFSISGGNSLTINNKFNLTATQGSKIYSLFLNLGETLNFTNDTIIDLSQAEGTFNNRNGQWHGIRDNKLLFDTAGNIAVNSANNSSVTVQLSGDIANFGGTTSINLANSNSFYKGKINALGNSTTTLNLSNGANADLTLTTYSNNGASPSFNLTLTRNSTAKVDTIFKTNQGNGVNFTITNSALFADFTYAPANGTAATTQGTINLSNRGIWYQSQSNSINILTINNPIHLIEKDNFLSLSSLAAVDFRFQNKGRSLRNLLKIDENASNRYVLKTSQISGANGVFRLKGVLNTQGWKTITNETQKLIETIATDKITTNDAFNTHYIQLFWNEEGFDKSLLNKNLESHHIVVAEQASQSNSDFVGKETPIGIYNYITHLKKVSATLDDGKPDQPNGGGGNAGGTGERPEENADAQNQNGNQGNAITTTPRALVQGFQWIVSNVQRVDNSYLSRLLDSLYQAQFRISKMETDTLNLRMGELRDMQRVDSVWLRTKYGRLGSKSTPQTTPSWDEYTSVWFGYDRNFFVLGGKNFLGLALNTTVLRSHGIPEGIDNSNESYLGNSRTYGISVYDTFLFNNGLYIDTIAKYYLTDNHYSINSDVLRGNSPDFITHSFLASVEVGKKFRLPIRTPDFNKSFYYLKPEAQMTFGISSGTSWVFSDWSNQKINARLDFNTPVNFRTGLKFGRQFDKPFLKGDVYLGANIEYDINTGGDLRLEDFLDKMTLTHQGNFNLRLNAGTNLILNEYWRLYFDIDTAFFGNINSTFTLNGGVRINFGRLHPKMPNISPVFDYEEEIAPNPYRRTIPEVQNYSTQGILDNYDPKRKRPKLPPKVNVKSKKFGPPQTNPDLVPKFSITPKVEQNQIGEPTFNDNPQEIQAPQKNYTRDNQKPISPNVEQQRDLEEIYKNYQKGYNLN